MNTALSFRTPARATALSLLALAAAAALLPRAAAAAELAATPAVAATAASARGYDGVVEAVRQTVLAAQVSGAVVELNVKVGDRVAQGQVLLRIDARSAEQAALAGEAQVAAARATQELARKDFERQQQLYRTNFISKAAFERAETEFQASQAQVNAQLAQAAMARTQTGWHVLRAPYAGVVSEVPVTLGDMALPGKPLVTVYDPAVLRVTAAVPQAAALQWQAQGQAQAQASTRVELPGQAAGGLTPTKLQVLPTLDPATHTVPVRAELPAGLAGVAPGLFARLWLAPAAADAAGKASAAETGPVTVPQQAVVRRAELTALYVLGEGGKPQLRQVRLGQAAGGRVEVLSGLAPGERVATDPQAAARLR